MPEKIKWGIISTANIGMAKVIPAMQKSAFCDIVAIASRNADQAAQAAMKLGIRRSYHNYESLLKDKDIDAVYIPLPNHLHVEWTRKAIEAGKHVLCEKPMTLTTKEAQDLINLRNKYGVKVGEAFMVDTHPQWINAVSRIKNGEIGKLKAINGFFSYYKINYENIRFKYKTGGGGLWDIGCYPVHTARWAFGEEPTRVIGVTEIDPEVDVDVLTSAIIQFPSGQAIFTVSMQVVPHQRMQFFGADKKIEIEIPFNAPNDRPTKIFIDDDNLFSANKKIVEFETCDQYTLQGDAFSKAILEDKEVPVPLENTLKNTAVIEAIFRSAESGHWENPNF